MSAIIGTPAIGAKTEVKMMDQKAIELKFNQSLNRDPNWLSKKMRKTSFGSHKNSTGTPYVEEVPAVEPETNV